jgi:dihydroxyacetone kinase
VGAESGSFVAIVDHDGSVPAPPAPPPHRAVLLDILFNTAAGALRAAPSGALPAPAPTPAAWAGAFRAGVGAVQFYGGAKAGFRTLLDALLPAADAADLALARGGGGAEALAAAATAAEAGAEATKAMEALAGRSSYVPPEVLLATPDPGALAMAIVLRAAASAVGGAYCRL